LLRPSKKYFSRLEFLPRAFEQPHATRRATKRQHTTGKFSSRRSSPSRINFRIIKKLHHPDPFVLLAVTTDGGKFWKTETSTSGFA